MLIVLMMVCRIRRVWKQYLKRPAAGSDGCHNPRRRSDPLWRHAGVGGRDSWDGDHRGNEHFPEYEDRTEAFYREKNGEYHMAYIHIRESSYTTYQGIRVGDNWEEVREKLNSDLTAETFSGARIVFDNGKQINANTDQDEWEEDWLVLGYVYNTEGDIISISVLDVKAFNFQ